MDQRTPDDKDQVVDESLVKELESIKQTSRQAAAAVPVQQAPQPSVGLQQPYSGFWRRAFALIIDTIILNIGLSLVYRSSSGVSPTSPYMAFSIFRGMTTSLVPWIVNIIYFSAMHAWRGQTIGKMATGIAVVNEQGQHPSIQQAVIREFGRILSTLVFGLGYLWMLFDRQRRTWHDIIAHTFVIKIRK